MLRLTEKRVIDPIEAGRCRTRYPVLLVHGTGFRDGHPLYNYWGRIPKALEERGAAIHYGKQDSWGSIEHNAEILKREILGILERDGAEKVNVIAHSKGGLDARYAISRLGMAECVASLTTISTPHLGSKVLNAVYDAPAPVVKFIAFFVNAFNRFNGDGKPDFFMATRQMSEKGCAAFNDETPDMPGILYQSYAGKMRGPFSDLIFFFLWIIVRLTEGDNDGLVAASSAKWGEWKGLIESGNWRGISHSDEVDAWRSNLFGFDVRKVYIGIVEDLRKRGL